MAKKKQKVSRNRSTAAAKRAAKRAANSAPDGDRDRVAGRPPGQGEFENTSVNDRWETTKKGLKWVGKCLAFALPFLGVVWGAFGILSYKLPNHPRVPNPWDVWSYCVSHPVSFPGK